MIIMIWKEKQKNLAANNYHYINLDPADAFHWKIQISWPVTEVYKPLQFTISNLKNCCGHILNETYWDC